MFIIDNIISQNRFHKNFVIILEISVKNAVTSLNQQVSYFVN